MSPAELQHSWIAVRLFVIHRHISVERLARVFEFASRHSEKFRRDDEIPKCADVIYDVFLLLRPSPAAAAATSAALPLWELEFCGFIVLLLNKLLACAAINSAAVIFTPQLLLARRGGSALAIERELQGQNNECFTQKRDDLVWLRRDGKTGETASGDEWSQ